MARSNFSIYAALAANIAIAAAKFVAGGFTGSASMISEGVHSLVDSVNELLLLYGVYRSNRKRDKTHPFGYGRELYFWSFIVAILIFGLGAGVSFFQGYNKSFPSCRISSPILPSSGYSPFMSHPRRCCWC